MREKTTLLDAGASFQAEGSVAKPDPYEEQKVAVAAEIKGLNDAMSPFEGGQRGASSADVQAVLAQIPPVSEWPLFSKPDHTKFCKRHFGCFQSACGCPDEFFNWNSNVGAEASEAGSATTQNEEEKAGSATTQNEEEQDDEAHETCASSSGAPAAP